MPTITGLYAIADAQYLTPNRIVPAVVQAIVGGAHIIQWRDKQQRYDITQLRPLADACRQQHVPLIINDNIELACALDADGVHLGRDDASIARARQQLGPNKHIGVSCYSDIKRAQAAQAAGANYVAFGRFFASPSKPEARPAAPAILRAAKAQLRIPIVAIGGITPDNGGELLAQGADSLAVISGVFAQPNIKTAAAAYAALFATVGDTT